MDDWIARIQAAEDFDAALAIILEAMVVLLGSERGYIALRDETTGKLTVRVAYGPDTATDDESSFPISRAVSEQVALSGEPVITTNAQEDDRYHNQMSIVNFGLRSIAAAPLKVGDEVVGVLYADKRLRTGLFGADELAALTDFTTQATEALARFAEAGSKPETAAEPEFTEEELAEEAAPPEAADEPGTSRDRDRISADGLIAGGAPAWMVKPPPSFDDLLGGGASPLQSPADRDSEHEMADGAPPLDVPDDRYERLRNLSDWDHDLRVQFSAYYPHEVMPDAWEPLAAYCFRARAADQVTADAQQELGERPGIIEARQPATQPVQEGALVTATPHMRGFLFNPPQASLYFFDDFQRFDFKLRPVDASLDVTAVGHITFTVEGVIVADVPLLVTVREAVTERATSTQAAGPYQAIFCSYSHDDTGIVRRVESAYQALGLEYLRDATTLRSGQHWGDELLAMIERADVFQLFWSASAAQSEYVAQEWQHALGLGRNAAFIRPVYWAQPMPDPPPELAGIHFAYHPELGGAPE